MGRVKALERHEVSHQFQEIFDRIEQRGGTVLNLFKVMAHTPEVGRSFLQLGSAILNQGILPANLRELAILRVGYLLDAHYEWAHHMPLALRAGVSKEQIDALPEWEASPQFDALEKAILRYTDEVTIHAEVCNETFAALRRFLDEQGIVELTTAVSYYCMVCRILKALKVDLE